MAVESNDPLLFLTNTIYGDSIYEQMLWRGVARAAREQGMPLCTIVGGQLLPKDGGVQVPYLFRVAGGFASRGTVFNGGTLQQGITHASLEQFLKAFPSPSKVVTSIPMETMAVVVVDNYAGMQAMVEHLITSLGKKRIAYISGPFNNSEALDRLRAYREVLARQGLPVDESLVFEGTWTTPSGSRAIQHFLENRIAFDAVACANDLMAIDALEEVQAQGLTVPFDVAITGFDDIDAARFCIPQLSTVFQPIADLGAEAVGMLVRKIRGQSVANSTQVSARMVLRASAPKALPQEGLADPSGETGEAAAGEDWQTALENRIRQSKDPLATATLDAVLQAWTGKKINLSAAALATLRQGHAGDARNFQALLTELREGLPRWLKTPQEWQRATGILQTLFEVHRDYQAHEAYQLSKKDEAIMSSLVVISRILNQVGSLTALEEALARGFGHCGITTCSVVLADSQGALQGKGRMVAGIVDGRPLRVWEKALTFPLSQVVAGGLPRSGEPSWLVYPLVFEDQELGYLVYQKSDVSPFYYESLANLVAGVLHSLLLIDRIEKAEEEAARRATRIGDLVRPMIAELQTTGASAREQGSTMTALVGTNAETARRLGQMGSQVDRIREALDNVVDLIQTVEEVSETIGVIAINAAIAAARAGSDGKVFGVISSEIRKLAIQTKANTGQIGGVLAELGGHAQGFLEANQQTSQVFSRLEKEILRLVESLEGIQRSMESMDRQAQLVLQTMGETSGRSAS